ncbi:hypothetical protein RF11_14860 [Thelohanellus kitauei]|uniref:Winged helix-turn helix domain-containing protein n=1 Tax=Thelohanellus kitauei TaxID=669202 RepID=A0A0C2N9F4_THEKT|nr:hypothetical protein RF11_14860 [Thelohanellus kitauei]
MKIKLVETINDDSTICIDDIIEKLHLSVDTSTVLRWLQKINHTWKLTRLIPFKRNDSDVKVERKSYCEWYQTINPFQRYMNIIYLDESPFNLQMIQTNAWWKKGKTTNPVLPKK